MNGESNQTRTQTAPPAPDSGLDSPLSPTGAGTGAEVRTMADKKYSAVTLTRVFIYLDNLRESGATNMFGAAPYIVQAFGFGKDEARALLSLWMKTYSDDTMESRVAQAVS